MSEQFPDKVTIQELSKSSNECYDAASFRALGIERDGNVEVVMVPAAEYLSLRHLFSRALHSKDLQDVISQITQASADPHEKAPQSYEQSERKNGD
ncbi:MAG: hypothetical protein AAF683_00165 [Pseudomonadota bacterium]